MGKARWKWIQAGLTLAALLFGPGPQATHVQGADKLERFEFVQIRMGIPVRILVYAPNSTSAIQASDAAYERIRQIDRALSDYDPESEIVRLSRDNPPGTPVVVSDDIWKVLTASKELSQRSHGVFDVTVGPVIKLWRIARRKRALPDEAALQAALAQVGDEFVELDSHRQSVTLKRPGMQLDFGGIAKGYAADEAYEVLKKHGLPISLVACAGDIRVGDPPPGESGWRVEVEDKTLPSLPDHPPLILKLANAGISTSGDTYQYLEVDGIRYSHIVDPNTGLGTTVPGSATVIARNAMEADGLASVMVLLGPEEGLELISKTPQTDTLIVRLEENGQRSVNSSPGWNQALIQAK
ncbi:FAD:protein FMN transferase [Planctomicrobium sp. SH661]|uniref:FAD:protein FMN transferase n=1 Tax=Planctomicrobium sp. SH661 TaxID=3448124 RepID=UPI003F5C0D9E